MLWTKLIRTLAPAVSVAVLSAAPLAAQELTTIKVNRSPVGTFQGLFIAEQLGYFEERGIQLEMHIGSTPDGAIAEVMSGESHVAMTGAVPTAAAVANGLPITAVLNTQDQGEPPTMGLLVPGDSDIMSIEDLAGKSIGLPGIASPQGLALLQELEKHGMSRDDVELVNLPFPGVLSAIESGAVDSGVPVGLFYTLGINQGMREFREVFDNLLGAPAVLFVANANWADDNAELLMKFNEAMLLAYEYGNANPDAIRAVDAEQTQMPPDFIANRDIAPFAGAFNVAEWRTQNEGLVTFGFLESLPADDALIWEHAPKQ